MRDLNMAPIPQMAGMHMVNGFRVKENPNLTVPVTTPVEWKWWEEVMAWNPCNEEYNKPRSITTYEPDRNIYTMGNTIVAHPVVIKQLIKTMEEENANNRR